MLKSNGLLKILLPFLVIVVLVIVIRGCNSDDTPDAAASGAEQKDASLTLTDDEIQALGIEGDTPRDTVATLVGEMRAMRKELDDTSPRYAKNAGARLRRISLCSGRSRTRSTRCDTTRIAAAMTPAKKNCPSDWGWETVV